MLRQVHRRRAFDAVSAPLGTMIQTLAFRRSLVLAFGPWSPSRTSDFPVHD